MRRSIAILGTAATLACAVPAVAHTPYLTPTTFAPDRDFVTAQAALAETNFFVPDFPIRGVKDFLATGPSGEVVKLGAGTPTKETLVVDIALPQQGTWKISTGEAPGRRSQWAKVGGQWRSVRPTPAGQAARPAPTAASTAATPAAATMGEDGERAAAIDASAVPAGAETITSQAYVKAEAYVSRGAPTRGALKPTGQGFELAPETHPNEIFAGEPFKFAFLDGGKPAAAVPFTIGRAGDVYAEKRYSHSASADAAGKAQVTFAEPGVYVLEAHWPLRTQGGTPATSSMVYSLTFEVTR